MTKRLLYDNCRLEAPDGTTLCYVSNRRAKWYLNNWSAHDQPLGVLVSEDPIVVRLSFVPSGMGRDGDEFYLTPRENKCVVCGTDQRLTRHHVVPQAFRRHFPSKFKEYADHDIVAACEPCHRAYCIYEEQFKAGLAKEKGWDRLGRPANMPRRVMRTLSLLKPVMPMKESIPPEGETALALRLYRTLGWNGLSPTELALLAEAMVVERTSSLGHRYAKSLKTDEEIQELCFKWRAHFVETMAPEFMPEHWDARRGYE